MDPGVPFLFFGLIPKNYKFNDLFGQVFTTTFDETQDLFVTNWRRLKLEKLTHIRDVFFSTLSTGFKNLSRQMKIQKNDLIEFYVSRNLFGLSVSQKCAEFLADSKYIFMASISEFSKTSSLIEDKIKGPFTKHLEIFILFNLIEKSKELILSLSANPIQIHEYVDETEDKLLSQLSVGGVFKLPYLWAKGSYTEFNDFLDSLHTYVHTVKEPASYYHETIKSIKTIQKFNDKYIDMTIDERTGFDVNKDTLLRLLDNNAMGFSAKFLNDAMQHFLDHHHVDFEKILLEKVFRDPLSHFASTKASIQTPLRKEESTARCKVIDAILLNEQTHELGFDLSRNLLHHTVNLLEYQKRIEINPIVDMCIKVQYGPKREFYVLDTHFRFALKFVEEYFKSICKQIPTECITVPGDLKLLKIQEINQKIRSKCKRNNLKQFFINGDCSKWSASEVMESFMVILISLKNNNKIPIQVYNVMFTLMSLWQRKQLQIDGRFFADLKMTDMTRFMFDDQGLLKKRIILPQNFLMGLMNYVSSFKGVITYEYSKSLLIQRQPHIIFKHLEHSDDYTIGLGVKKNEIKTVKTFITCCMRFGSITDSDKKQSLQIGFRNLSHCSLLMGV